MSSPFLGEIRIVAFNFAPKGWALCNGQLLPINQNQALFTLLGTQYGGNGNINFALPDFRGRIPLHPSVDYTQGERGGEENHTLIISEMPAHLHLATAASDSTAADQTSPAGAIWANGNEPAYSAGSNNMVAMANNAIGNAGGSQAHENRAPYLALNFIIALQGIFPSSG